MPTNKDSVPVPEYGDDSVNEYVQTQRAASENKASTSQGNSGQSSEKSKSQSGAKSRKSSGSTSKSGSKSGSSSRTPKSEETEDKDESGPDPKQRTRITSTLENGLQDRMRGLVSNALVTGNPPGIDSTADFLNWAVAEGLAKLEKQHNEGKPWPAPRKMQRGAPSKDR